MRGLFINDLGACSCAPFKFKRDPSIIAAGIAAGASLASGVISSSSAANMNQASRDYDWVKTNDLMYFNNEQAEKARQGQRDLLKQEQDWNEYMYGQYSSPSAMMRQYREAGMNPYLVDAQPTHGQTFNSPSAPSSPQASAPSTGQPPVVQPDFSGIGRAGQAMLEGVAVKANVANQSAQTVNQAIQNYIEMSKLNVPKEERDTYLRNQLSLAYGSSFDADRFIRSIDLDNQAKDVALQREQLSLSLDKQFSAKERQAILDQVDQSITESVSRIGMMASEAELNEAKCEQIAQDIVESVSRIYKNYAEGSNAELQGFELMALYPYTAQLLQLSVAREELTNEETTGNSMIKNMNKTKVGKVVNLILHYLQRAFSAGNVGVGLNLGKNTSTIKK